MGKKGLHRQALTEQLAEREMGNITYPDLHTSVET